MHINIRIDCFSGKIKTKVIESWQKWRVEKRQKRETDRIMREQIFEMRESDGCRRGPERDRRGPRTWNMVDLGNCNKVKIGYYNIN